jgi:hypothetical protein
LRDLSNRVIDFSGFEGGDAIRVSATDSAQLSRRCDDNLEILMKLLGEFDQDEGCAIEKKLRN